MVIGEADATVIKSLNHVGVQRSRLRVWQGTRRQGSVVHATDIRSMSQCAYIAPSDCCSRIDLVLNAEVELVCIGILDVRVVVPVNTTREEGSRCGQTGAHPACRKWVSVSCSRSAGRSRRPTRDVEVIGN